MKPAFLAMVQCTRFLMARLRLVSSSRWAAAKSTMRAGMKSAGADVQSSYPLRSVCSSSSPMVIGSAPGPVPHSTDSGVVADANPAADVRTKSRRFISSSLAAVWDGSRLIAGCRSVERAE